MASYLRPLQEKDIPLMLEWMKDPDIVRFFRFDAEHQNEASVGNFVQRSQTETDKHFAIADDQTDEYYGTISLKAIDRTNLTGEIAIVLRKCAQGRGFGRCSMRSLLEYAFYELGLNRVYSNVLSVNEISSKLFCSCGFKFEGEFRQHWIIRGEKHDLKWYGCLKEEYERGG